MQRGVIAGLLVALLLAPAAAADVPALAVGISAASGAAPLSVTLTAAEGAGSYRWDFGDGGTGEGRVVQHTYAEPGAYTAIVTAMYADGHTARGEAVVTAFRLSLVAPRSARYGERARFRAALAPALVGAPIVLERNGIEIARARTGGDGVARLVARIGSPGPYAVRFGEIASEQRSILVRPALEARLVGSPTVGARLRLVARVIPQSAGTLDVRVLRNGRVTYAERHVGTARIALYTRRPSSFRLRVAVDPAPGYAPAVRALAATVVEPRLALGSRGPAVLDLERRLAALRYALPRTDSSYGLDTYEAVLAFQKVEGLPWTGRVDPRVWRRLLRARTPRARYGGNHIEVNKGRQVLFDVRKGRVLRVIHISTGATGNTPLGRWRVYRKVVGWDWVLWYPMYFLRGFAVHGYPSVPAYPASHGCVRVPMWIAPSLFASHSYGTSIYVY